MISGLTALQGAGFVSDLLRHHTQDAASAGKAGDTSFSSMVADAAGRTVGKLQDAENVSLQALQGKADTREVADAVMTAEQTLQAAIAIRDKVVSAYLEVSHMQI